MNAALGQLFYLRMRGGIRHRLGQLKTPRGAMFGLIVIAIIWALQAAGATTPGDYLDDATFQTPEDMRAYITNFMPLGLFAACLFTVFVATGPAVYFSQNEINFLYTGPFKRRDLIVYKFLTYFSGAIVSAAIITLLIPPRASTGLAAFSGTLLTLLFIQ
ncbi:MAG: putative ABC exporter domain-containing protein, partial [Aestuariivirgaceae bacterium]